MFRRLRTTRKRPAYRLLRVLSPKVIDERFARPDRFATVAQNPFRVTREEPVSSFSIDVDTASNSFGRAAPNDDLLPQPAAVRPEEMVNYFPYDYASPRSAAPPSAAGDQVVATGEAAFALAEAPPPPPPPPPAPVAITAAPARRRTIGGDEIVVTGARAVIDREGVAPSPANIVARRIAAPDLDRCTIADPRRDIEACRPVIEKAVPTAARPFVLDGVSRAWRGDLEGAAATLDRAIARAPRSAFAYCDRSLVLSPRGDARRADADRKRAAELDDRYRAALRRARTTRARNSIA